MVPLKVEGNRLTGTGQSQEGKQAVSVNLTRRVAGGNFNFEGTITSGSITEKIRSTDNTEMTEEEITDQFLAEPAIEPSPADFTAAWPQALHARVGRAALTGLLEALRDQNVRLRLQQPAAVMPRAALGQLHRADRRRGRACRRGPGQGEIGVGRGRGRFLAEHAEHGARGALPVRRLARWRRQARPRQARGRGRRGDGEGDVGDGRARPPGSR